MTVDAGESPQKKIIHTIILLFGLLIAAIIANAIYICVKTNQDNRRHANEDVRSRMNIVMSAHDNQIEKLKIISLIAKEQNQKFCNFIDYDNTPAITYMLKSLVSIHDIDFAAIFDESGDLMAAYPTQPAPTDRGVYRQLIGNGKAGVSLAELPAAVVKDQLYQEQSAKRYPVVICFRAIIPLLHDTGDDYGYVVLVKGINGNQTLIARMRRLSKAEVIYFDPTGTPLLTSFKPARVPFPETDMITVADRRYFATVDPLFGNNGQPIGYLSVASDHQAYRHHQRQMLAGTLIPFVVSALMSILVFFLLKRRVFDKIGNLSRALRKVSSGQGDLSIRLATADRGRITASTDEVEYMCLDFNLMMDKLETTYLQMIEARQEVEATNKALEERVQERTAQLSAMYQDLKTEMEERQRAEEQRYLLEKSLERARKMEALGTLAGGVAHDLNNILSGLVSYPELLLLDLPVSSPLRGPIETIKTSGEKAASIVQDLLTLARRGMANVEPVCLNDIIKGYLSSHECAKMLSYHTTVRVEAGYTDNIPRIMGSPVHLSKVIMNLVSNAAEAMPQGGRVLITTDHCHLDRPIKGYHAINAGEYIQMKVSDNGLGIPPEDIERIFEPFFTKKILGRSGTGLGMSVVWGTVKDHNGYIDVQSDQGKGTTFTIYLPATWEEKKQQQFVPLSALRGNGETVLIVDDIQEQREIASQMVKKLGYRPITVKSGEEAVAFLKQHHVDVLILDMIMSPGIDGLETYERIAKFKPRQRAVIASGYSETDRVKTAQQIGVGSYIKKPYSLEELGLALRGELGRAGD
jgi:signal transduction histidine kinase